MLAGEMDAPDWRELEQETVDSCAQLQAHKHRAQLWAKSTAGAMGPCSHTIDHSGQVWPQCDFALVQPFHRVDWHTFGVVFVT